MKMMEKILNGQLPRRRRIYLALASGLSQPPSFFSAPNSRQTFLVSSSLR